MSASNISALQLKLGFWVTLLILFGAIRFGQSAMFDDQFKVSWGNAKVLDHGQTAQLSLDKISGSGFESKDEYLFGRTSLRIKLVSGNSAGIVTAFYMTSDGSSHDELDFEFLGNVKGKPVTLQTNLFADGKGNREQKIHLWFDPTKDFHNYSIFWNQHHIVFWVDNIPVRVHKASAGVEYPKRRPMRVMSTIWNGEDWATNGGKAKIDWTLAPFVAEYQLFQVDGCPAAAAAAASASSSSSPLLCEGSMNGWDGSDSKTLSPDELRKLEWVKKNYMTYDYCTDRRRFPYRPSECAVNP